MPGLPAPFAARGSSSLISRHGLRRLGLPRATPRNRVPSGTAEAVPQPRASRSDNHESDRSVKPSVPHSRKYLSWPLSPPTPTFTALPHYSCSVCNRSTTDSSLSLQQTAPVGGTARNMQHVVNPQSRPQPHHPAEETSSSPVAKQHGEIARYMAGCDSSNLANIWAV